MSTYVILIGTGPMAVDYTKVLQAQKVAFTVVGRGEKSAEEFASKTGIVPVKGGIQNFLKKNTIPANSSFIIATGTEGLMPCLLSVVPNTSSRILVEKPAAISIGELIENEKNLLPYAENIFVAYNRRFYVSVMEAERLIKEDGGLQSMHFEFTEWAHKIEPLKKASGVKENWFFANSTHVIDLAFFLAGKPVKWQAFSNSGKLTWHSKTNFTGAGITEKGVLFSYLSNWESAGRWGIELLTSQHRIYLKPMEKMSVQLKGSIAVDNHVFDDSLDREFKPGLYRQVQAFLDSDNTNLINIKEHICMARDVYEKIIA